MMSLIASGDFRGPVRRIFPNFATILLIGQHRRSLTWSEVESGNIDGIVSAAYLLSPTIPKLNVTYRGTSLPGRLFHPEYCARFRFGALTLRPGMSNADIGAALRIIVTDAWG